MRIVIAAELPAGRVDPEMTTAAKAVTLDLFHNLRYSREQELEADRIGLEYMAMAGYDPREALQFWRRMQALAKGSPAEFLSTHPAEGHRLAQIQERMPAALDLWKASGGGSDNH